MFIQHGLSAASQASEKEMSGFPSLPPLGEVTLGQLSESVSPYIGCLLLGITSVEIVLKY